MTNTNDINASENAFSKKVTLFSFIMTFFVVFSHWTHFYRMTNPTASPVLLDALDSFFSMMGIAALASFFMMSGFMFFRGVEAFSDLKGKMLRRLISLGIPFIFWNFIFLVYELLYGLVKGGVDIDIIDVLFGFSFAPLNAPMWYLLALLVLMCFSPLILMLKKHPRVALICTVAVYAGVYILYFFSEGGNWAYNWVLRLLGYAPIYMLGAVLALCAPTAVTNEQSRRYGGFISAGAGVLSLVIILIVTLGDVNNVKILWFIHQLLPVLLWTALPMSLCSKARISFPLTVAPFVYAMHSLLILILNSLWTQKIFSGVDFPFALDMFFLVILVGILYGVCLGVAFVARKLLPEKIYKIFAGGSAGRKMF